MWSIHNEDAIKWAKEYSGEKFHALLTDAPYHLTSVVKRFGKAKLSDNTRTSERVRNREDGYSRLVATGFMGSTWDGGDIAFRPETWAAFGEVLYPGAFGMAFSASRNWHRMAVAIEDAGFIIHPTMFFLWIQGQGFPKATRVKGHEEFEGHRYGLQALKPSVEPIIVFQKPYEGKPIDNIVSTGAGALNIDAARIPLATADASQLRTMNRSKKTSKDGWGMNDNESDNPQVVQESGRWPANLILTEESAERLDAQTGNLPAGTASANSGAMGYHGGKRGSTPEMTYADNGGASRFFYQVSTQLDEADPFLYQSKVSPKERNAGLEDLPLISRRPSGDNWGEQTMWNGENGDEEWKKKNPNNPVRNPHPTLKPIALAKYLATLLLPPVEYAPRRIFIPFSGSGSEMIGAGLAGWEHVVGVEFDTENNYVEIAKKRLEHWLK